MWDERREERPIRLLRDVGDLRAGQVLSPRLAEIRRVAPPMGFAGFAGWFVRFASRDYSLEDGVDAEVDAG